MKISGRRDTVRLTARPNLTNQRPEIANLLYKSRIKGAVRNSTMTPALIHISIVVDTEYWRMNTRVSIFANLMPYQMRFTSRACSQEENYHTQRAEEYTSDRGLLQVYNNQESFPFRLH